MEMQLLFYLIIVVVIIVKLLFWSIYFIIRKRRLKRRRQEARVIDTCYEEVPAVPQPAYVFSGLSPEDLRHAVLIESLPGYQADDPYKRDMPPPSYGDNFHQSNVDTPECSTSRRTLDALVENIETHDTADLVENEEVDDDDLICMQQMT